MVVIEGIHLFQMGVIVLRTNDRWASHECSSPLLLLTSSNNGSTHHQKTCKFAAAWFDF